MSYRKIVNRMRKAQKISAEAMQNYAEVGGIGVRGADHSVHNECVEAYNVHVGIWNKLQRYVNSLTKRPQK